MDQAEFDRVAASFAAFHARFAPLFGRKEAQRRSEQYLRGLLVQQTDRRNAENVAETIAGDERYSDDATLGPDEAARERFRQFVERSRD